MAGQLILGLSILVGLHELGHLLAAKMFGMRVEQFSIGFPPKIFGIKFGETEYAIGAIPLGGYVKISGMIDESMDTDQMKQEPQPWEFRSKPAWQRLIVMMGGIIVNVITGIVIFVLMLYFVGKEYLPASEAKNGIVAHELAQKIGLQTGDKIIKINGKDFKNFSDVSSTDVLLNTDSYYTVNRNGKIINVPVPNNLIEQLSDKNEPKPYIDPIVTFKVGRLAENKPSFLQKIKQNLGLAKPEEDMPAVKAGLKPGDKIVRINNKPITYYHQLQESLLSNKNKNIALGIERNGQPQTLNLTVTPKGQIGFQPEFDLKYDKIDYSFGRALAEGPGMAFGVVYNNIKAFGKIFRGEVSASKSLSGPIGIAQIFGGTWEWDRFWSIVGLLSMVLAFMNFLPIPALDGGHVAFLTYEIVSGRSPSDKFLEVAQKVGMVLLLGLMAFAIFNDVFKLFR